MGFDALAGLAATCVWDAADQVVHAGLHFGMRVCHYAYSCMQACWLGDGRLARSVGRASVKFHLYQLQVVFLAAVSAAAV